MPALPKAWPSGSVAGLRARGCCEVDIRWSSGMLDEATIRVREGGSGHLRLFAGMQVTVISGEVPVNVVYAVDGTAEWPATAGSTYIVRPRLTS
ncbi:hypothetical protein RE628_12575 [Paenibacillus sp. D2_2]|uniref:glycoside hydrolase family 95-like protein n=1 Tax=Paenibacillus sp. D2_2 TaxID=3073092 RepID=UPI002814E516|nr:hypothetical protein [Paenibacillus sp. D2_2]WMT43028.1 hypothetical protein RE628_12575 [Paenibacillus sp. D2_2]